jgi:chromate transporter
MLLVLFFFPIWNNLKKHVMIYRALEGINAVVVGIMWAATFILFFAVNFTWYNILIMLGTLSLLYFTRFPAPIIVLVCILMGWWFS